MNASDLFCKGIEKFILGPCYLGEDITWCRCDDDPCNPANLIPVRAYVSVDRQSEEAKAHAVGVVTFATVYVLQSDIDDLPSTRDSFLIPRRYKNLPAVPQVEDWKVVEITKRNKWLVAWRVKYTRLLSLSDPSQRLDWRGN